MLSEESTLNVTVIWRGNKYVVEMNFDASLKQLGDELQKLTGVMAETMRLIIPQSLDKGSRLLSPFSDKHSGLSLHEVSIIKGKSIRMMGVSEDEVDKVLRDAKVDLRIAGFDEEDKRIRQRASYDPQPVLKLPQGPYIFRDFRTLELPGIELNPPASEALKRMHMLAADPGIVAIMNKHHWCIGIMTEMAPVGYVGVSPKCILGFNKNHGEEISLRLRTDDLKGFRKYESIKKTLLHELAHMVYSEHDANFYALDKQLNEEAASLDWTKSNGHTLTRVRHPDHHEEDVYVADNRTFSQKLGGNVSDQMASARASSVAAAYRRLANASPNISGASETLEEPDPDYSSFIIHNGPAVVEKHDHEPDPDDSSFIMHNGPAVVEKHDHEPDPDDSSFIMHNGPAVVEKHDHEPDPDEHSCDPQKCEPDPDDSHAAIQPSRNIDEPDPDDSEAKQDNLGNRNDVTPHRRDSLVDESMEVDIHPSENYKEPDPDESQNKVVWAEPDPDDSQSRSAKAEPDPDDALVPSLEASSMQIDEPDPDDQELWRIQDPVTLFCSRLQKTIEMLRGEVGPKEATGILQTLFKIIRNVIENQDNLKFKRLRKGNPTIQKNIANHKAAMEILQMVGFSEDVVSDELGKVETYLVLKRNDPGLLWLAKSSLEACVP